MGNTPKRSMTQRLAKNSDKVFGHELDGAGSFSLLSSPRLSEESPSKNVCSSDMFCYFSVTFLKSDFTREVLNED